MGSSEFESTDLQTLTKYVLDRQRHHPEASGDLTILMNAIQVACKYLENCVRKASLNQLVGLAGTMNVQGEDQKKLDILANEIFINTLRASGRVASMVSEEVPNLILVEGRHKVAAGYCMYGSSCNLVVSMGNNRVDGFTLDSSFGEFILTHPKIKVPNRGKIYSTNEGNAMYWDEATRKYIDSVKFPDPSSGKKPYSARYIGSMVGDVHRTLLYG
ncbi:hypothetical protein BB560_002345, partial [Smittium megazygosporum]